MAALGQSSTQVVSSPPGWVAQWLDLLDAGERLLLAGLRREIGPEGDLQAAYRRWYEDEMREHDEVVTRVCQRLRSRAPEGQNAP